MTTKTDFVKCCYCGTELTHQGQARHQERCIKSPDMAERVKNFVRNYHATHGRITANDWRNSDERKAQQLPDDAVIWRSFSGWRHFVEWCGVEYKREHRRVIRSQADEAATMRRLDREFAAARKDIASAYDFSAIAAIDRGIKRLYDPVRMTYYTAHVMELR